MEDKKGNGMNVVNTTELAPGSVPGIEPQAETPKAQEAVQEVRPTEEQAVGGQAERDRVIPL